MSEFRSALPTYLRPQTRTLDWLCAAHTQAEVTRWQNERRQLDVGQFCVRMRAALARFGSAGEGITRRGYELEDCEHTRWDEMQVYRLHEHPSGVGMGARTKVFESIAGAMLDRLYAERPAAPPSDLFHVTCTGYTSPSAAQQLVSRLGWGAHTRVAHVYHMGCYAAFPALRLASGAHTGQPGARARSEVVHTEVCSLHLDPTRHEPEQLVIQSLFADGAIAYGLTSDVNAELRTPGFEVVSQLERLLPNSAAAMTWACADRGMLMTLGREVPQRLGEVLRPFVNELIARAGLNDASASDAFFAVHPGGPRILDRVQDLLRLEAAQLEHSRKVLAERGNMSSATVPHIWMEMANDTRIEPGAWVVSLGFGPGLTICGAVLRKVVP